MKVSEKNGQKSELSSMLCGLLPEQEALFPRAGKPVLIFQKTVSDRELKTLGVVPVSGICSSPFPVELRGLLWGSQVNADACLLGWG